MARAQARYRRDGLHKVATSLGQEQFQRAYAKGTALSLDRPSPWPPARPSTRADLPV